MKILHISAFALRGGCEKNCYHFINASPEHRHEIIVLDTEGPMSSDWNTIGDLNVKHLNSLHYNIFSFKKTLDKALKNDQYDLAICWSTIRLPLQLHALFKAAKTVNVYLGNPVSANYKPLKDKILQRLYPIDKGAVKLMACSDYVAQSYSHNSYYKQFYIKTSLNPVAIPDSVPTRVQETDRKEFRLGMVARLDPIKDHSTVIDGFKIIIQQIPYATLHLVGDGSLKKSLQHQVSEKGISHAVHFHGDVKNVYAHLESWHVFVYATTPEEGLGSAVEEAMANGLPCILSDLPMLKELAPHNDLALWFKAHDPEDLAIQILYLYKNKGEQARIGLNAYRHAQRNFQIKRFIKDFIQ